MKFTYSAARIRRDGAAAMVLPEVTLEAPTLQSAATSAAMHLASVANLSWPIPGLITKYPDPDHAILIAGALSVSVKEAE